MKEFRFYSMMRSGHHAVMNWLYKQIPGSVIMANAITGPLWRENAMKFFVAMKQNRLATDAIDPNLSIIGRNLDKPLKYAIYNIEDEKHPYLNLCFTDLHRQLGLTGTDLVNVIVLRDIYNVMASRFSFMNKPARMAPHHVAIDIWKVHAREFCRRTQTLSNLVPINYNKWFKDQKYRISLIEALGFEFTDAGFNEVPNYGGGSSFDGLLFGNRASDMLVLNRYKQFIYNDDFRSLFDEEAIILNKEIFGERKLFL